MLDAYEKRCAITGCAMEDVLEAAHIIPYMGDDTNRCDNGLLLRATFTLSSISASCGSIEMKVEVASALRRTEYGKLRGKGLRLPTNAASRPHPEHLERHAQIASELREVRR